MKSNLIYCFIGVVLFTLDCSCKKDPIVSQTQNLIKNPSFEINGQPTAENWFFVAGGIEGDTSTSLSQDTPPRGGNWSLPLFPVWTEEGYAKTYITGLEGTNIYNLSVWMKSNNGWPGSISIGVLSQNQLTQAKSVSDTITNWNEYILIDTLTTTINDTIVVKLSAGIAPFSSESDKVLFDLVELKKL